MADVLLNVRGSEAAAVRLVETTDRPCAPHLIDVEVTQVIRRHVAAGVISAARGQAALLALADLPLMRFAHADLLPRIWELRPNLSAYDAAYVALAEGLNAILVTRDGRLAGAPGHWARIELV